MKPRVFIGSSVEGLHIAEAIQLHLQYVAEVTLWSQGVFNLSSTTLHDLLEEVATSDFAVFVFHPDDVLHLRAQAKESVRDNVIFETGLFIGKIGLDRVFFVKPRGNKDLHIPTDLIGITPGEYDDQRSDDNWDAAVGSACTLIKRQITKSFLTC